MKRHTSTQQDPANNNTPKPSTNGHQRPQSARAAMRKAWRNILAAVFLLAVSFALNWAKAMQVPEPIKVQISLKTSNHIK